MTTAPTTPERGLEEIAVELAPCERVTAFGQPDCGTDICEIMPGCLRRTVYQALRAERTASLLREREAAERFRDWASAVADEHGDFIVAAAIRALAVPKGKAG